jgi:hypothetical protein
MTDKPPTDTNPGVATGVYKEQELTANIARIMGVSKHTGEMKQVRLLLVAALQEQDIESRLKGASEFDALLLEGIKADGPVTSFRLGQARGVYEMALTSQAKQQKGQQRP